MPGERQLPRATPESQCLPSGAVTALLDDLADRGLEMHSLMVVARGAVVAEGWWAPYERERPHAFFSLSKSFTSTAVGLAQAEGLLSVDDLVLTHFPEDAPTEVDPNLAQMRVRHLLSMTTGHHEGISNPVFASQDWVRAFLAQPVQHEPGTHFVYNTAASYVLSALVQKVSGQRLLDYLGPRLFDPLGITGATWDQSPNGVDTGGFGLAGTTEDIACFGLLHLCDGVWQGRRLLPDGWVAEATRRQTYSTHYGEPDWEEGYGFQFWRGRHGTYRGDGAFGQFCLVLPDQDAVVAITSGVRSMQGVLDAVWQNLLPAFGDGGQALDDDADAQAALTARLAGLRLDPPEGAPSSPVAAAWAGREIVFEPNSFGVTSAVLEPAGDATTIRARWGDDVVVLVAGHGRWVAGHLPTAHDDFDPHHPGRAEPVVAGVVWPAPDTMLASIRLHETPFMLTLEAIFGDTEVAVRADVNVSFGSTYLGDVVGRLAAPA